MSSAAKKIPPEQPLDAIDQPSDRELKLARNFEDPKLDDLIPISLEPATVTEEAAAAVHELVLDVADTADVEGFENLPIPDEALAIPPSSESSIPRALPQTVNLNPDPLERSLLMEVPPDGIEEPAGLLSVGIRVAADNRSAELYSMCERLFELVICERTFAELVDGGLRAIMTGLDAQSASVLEIDHEREDFFFRASIGGSPMDQLSAFRVPLNKGIVGHVAESGQPLLIRDLAADQLQLQAVKLSLGFEAVTCMAAPIIVGGQPYGVIEIFNRRTGGHFDEKDLAALEDAVRMFAKVLEVRFLLAELSRRIR